MKYIETLREGERVTGVYLCKFCQPAVTKNGYGIRIPRGSTISRQWITLILWGM